MDKQTIIFQDLGIIPYKQAWDYQESLLQKNVQIKMENRQAANENREIADSFRSDASRLTPHVSHLTPHATTSYLLFCEHPAVYTLGKSGKQENVLIDDEAMKQKGIEFFNTNRGGDITFHGLQQIVGYPIIDLENFYTDIGRYLRELEEVIILTLAEYNIKGERSKGETGVWIEPGIFGKERKICAMGVRCSRWITMHGFALNVNTDLSYFNNIVPCGIQNKQVTSIERELGYTVPLDAVKEKLKNNFEKVFNVRIINKKEEIMS
ncbi:lipoyl(octanoyl) transferase LipB [Ferruginibacter albus]|uniref:lipoyl(octanoyl) transferase LipB n=1 Tax=Ferruginibacter albus TaxID=2875540 RepID=UPI001CC73C37|nr:lipoyl(octanoyl) transferase LipB [Ferruginibacter albus]UAY53553.1 lipoyl(octanoyl) transferase LipB [Ferruginibacter albus]